MAELQLNVNFKENLQLDLPKNDEKDNVKQNESKKSNFQKYAESNSVGGLSYVLTSKSKIRRFIWLVIILVCVAISLYLLRNSFSKVLNPPTSTTITNDLDVSLEFPAVTICNVNTFSAEKLRSYGIDPANFGSNYREYIETLDDFNKTTRELVHTSASNSIGGCGLGRYECNVDEDFDFSLKTLLACFTFNSGRKKPIKKVNGTGENNGLHFYFDVREDDYVRTVIGDAGVRIVVHPQDEPPHPDRFGVAASPGTYMHISFKKQIFDDQTQQECLTGDQYKWMHLSEEFGYSYASCLEDSITNISISECGCVLSTDNLSSDQYSICNSTNFLCYVDNIIFAEPSESCRPACKHTTFEIISATHTKYPADFVNNTEKDGLILVSVFYQTLNVQTQTIVYTYGVEEFFAEVGGQLGLFIGVSVITCFEFVIFLLDEVKNRMKVH